jgi:hypothetical protein
VTVVHAELIGRCPGNVEERIEALGHESRRDPVGERHQAAAVEQQILGLEHVGHRDLAAIQTAAVLRAERLEALGRDRIAVGAATGEQDSGFLEGLADRTHTQRDLVRRQPVDPAAARVHAGFAVARCELAAGKHHRTRREVDLLVAHDHEDLESLRAVAQKQDRGGQARRGRGGLAADFGRARHGIAGKVQGTCSRAA